MTRYTQVQEMGTKITNEEQIMSVETDAAKMTVEQSLAIRKEAGLLIDPAIAEVFWCWARVADPYGVYDLPKEHDCIGARILPVLPEFGCLLTICPVRREMLCGPESRLGM